MDRRRSPGQWLRRGLIWRRILAFSKWHELVLAFLRSKVASAIGDLRGELNVALGRLQVVSPAAVDPFRKFLTGENGGDKV
jgi:hypothetical protein